MPRRPLADVQPSRIISVRFLSEPVAEARALLAGHSRAETKGAIVTLDWFSRRIGEFERRTICVTTGRGHQFKRQLDKEVR